MAKDWRYADSRTMQVGTMTYTVCNQQIAECRYRYRETADAFLPQHRKCCADDPHWAAIDQKEERDRIFQERRRRAYDAFVAEFGVPDDLVRAS